MRETFNGAAATVLGLLALAIVAVGIGWAANENDLAQTRYFAPRQEAVRRSVFEQSKAYNQGQIQELQNMWFDYERTDPQHQAALAGLILHRAADFDEDRLPPDLRSFIESLRLKQAGAIP